MDSDSWSNLFSSSNARRYQSRSDLFGHEETDGDDEIKAEFLCPFARRTSMSLGFVVTSMRNIRWRPRMGSVQFVQRGWDRIL
ncbi:hypothetical protein M0R45_021067 [Rubus argutus]|uniref:Uncharacterized protein n=1 Tax=Rubus argutus TaxID=59490 RepID=A0AAW1XBZ1_RUBAR